MTHTTAPATGVDITKAISDGAATFAVLLDSGFMDECVNHLNTHFVLPHMSKLANERLPTHQRNLTDARTRIGTLLEHGFALALQRALDTRGITEYRISHVVNNRYPDLYIRDASSTVAIRMEVKALELISEEKSANFDALVRDINPQQDLLCVLLWEWAEADYDAARVDAPLVRRGFAFEAYPIAKARDLGWLAQRDPGQVKGIDFSGPVVGNTESLKKEEHNMGKLMRILDDAAPLSEDLARYPSVREYRAFRSTTISEGLAHNATAMLKGLGIVIEQPDDFVHSATAIQTVASGSLFDGSKHVIVATGGRLTLRSIRAYAAELNALESPKATVLIFTDKFNWSIYDYDGRVLTLEDKGRKAPSALRCLRSLLGL